MNPTPRIAAAILVATALSASAANAQTPASLAEVIKAVGAKGYTVHDIESEGSWFDIEATTRDGARVELIVDAKTADILGESLDD